MRFTFTSPGKIPRWVLPPINRPWTDQPCGDFPGRTWQLSSPSLWCHLGPACGHEGLLMDIEAIASTLLPWGNSTFCGCSPSSLRKLPPLEARFPPVPTPWVAADWEQWAFSLMGFYSLNLWKLLDLGSQQAIGLGFYSVLRNLRAPRQKG